MDVFLKIIGIIEAYIVATVLQVIAEGWTLSVLWGWFAVKIFNLPELSIPEAVGVLLIVEFMAFATKFTEKKPSSSDGFKEVFSQAAFVTSFKCLFALGVGWSALQFI